MKTFKTIFEGVIVPDWLREKFPNEMTIIIQYEYWNFKLAKSNFKITLSFNNIRSDLTIPFDSVISFADPYANFGLKLNSIVESKKQLGKKTNATTKIKSG